MDKKEVKTLKKMDIVRVEMITFLLLVEKIIDKIFEDEEIKKEIEELKSKKIRFFSKKKQKKLVEKIDDKTIEKIEKINERNKKRNRRRPTFPRGEVEKKIANNPAFVSMNEKIHDEIRKIVEAKLDERISQK